MVQCVRMYDVRCFFSDAGCAAVLRGSMLGILLVLRVLHSSVWCPNTASTGSMSSTSTEGQNTASTGSMMSSTQPRVQQAVPAVQTSEMGGALAVSRVLNP